MHPPSWSFVFSGVPMVAASKVFVQQLSWLSCIDLLHPHSCRRAAWQNLYSFAWSNVKYYLPVVALDLVKHALRGKRGLHLVFGSLLYHVQLVFGGVVVGWLIACFICLLRNLLGEFRLPTFLFAPSVMGAAFIAFVPKRVKELQHTALFQALIESLLLQRSNPVTQLVGSSRWLQTLLFMSCSSIIMLGKQRRWYNGFWFVTPEETQLDSPESRTKYVVQGMRKYLLIGLALDIFKALLSCVKTNRWSFGQLNLETMAWLGCYVGLYRSILCYMQSKPEVGQTVQQMVSSFLGGFSFVCYPKLSILSYALLEAGRSLWGKFNSRRKSRFGYSDLVYPLAMAYLIHTYTLQPQRVSAITGIIIDSSTANYASDITKRLKQLQLADGK